ncbi:MAG: hypothetical protein NT145_05290 [Elusimicrobia bacterium]|nr:hypothetical protein [Elusimicrobiota bacterium]
MEIRTVKTKEEFKKFIRFPWEIYKRDNNWVPPLIGDIEFIFGKNNPFWEHSEKELYLVYDDSGKILGRIAAIIDRNYLKFQNDNIGFFGFFESVNDGNVAKMLFSEVNNWFKLRGIEKFLGPMNPSTNDEIGFLCENFSEPPKIMMPYNPTYYLELAEKAGLKKAKELYAYDMDVSNGPLERLERIASITYKKNPGLKVRKFSLDDYENDVKRALNIYNEAWEKNWGFVPWTEKEFYTMAHRLKDLLLLDTTLIAEINDKPVGLLIAVPDYNFILKKINGKLTPLGILKFIYYRSRLKEMRLMIMGVIKQYRQKGIEGVLYYESLKNTQKLGYKKCEFSWVLDDNIMTQRAAEMMGGKLYKKYRVYGN